MTAPAKNEHLGRRCGCYDRRKQFVIATGGGTFVKVENRRFMESRGWTVALEGRTEILHARIEQQLRRAEPGAIRPLLDAVYPLEQVRSLKHSRQSAYALERGLAKLAEIAALSKRRDEALVKVIQALRAAAQSSDRTPAEV